MSQRQQNNQEQKKGNVKNLFILILFYKTHYLVLEQMISNLDYVYL